MGLDNQTFYEHWQLYVAIGCKFSSFSIICTPYTESAEITDKI